MKSIAELKQDNVFCILPWVSAHQSPDGQGSPCCLSTFIYDYDKIEYHDTIEDLMNSEQFKRLRTDMLNGRRNSACEICYNYEDNTRLISFRNDSNIKFSEYFDVVEQTAPDGTIPVKARLLDIRFDKLCSMKCRSCSDGFSTLWETENRMHLEEYEVPPASQVDPDLLLQSIIEQIPNLQEIYFAGGEPLISKYHYIILKELIKQGRTDVSLRYNTNLGSLTYKDEDLLALWEKFDEPVQLGASLDHYGERAEYIRHGVSWDKVEANYRKVLAHPNTQVTITPTITNLNYVTLGNFLLYLYNNDILPDGGMMLNLTTQPDVVRSQDLPPGLKAIGYAVFESAVKAIRDQLADPTDLPWLHRCIEVMSTVPTADRSDDNWEKFWRESERLDAIRNESLVDTFPELAAWCPIIPIKDEN